MRHDTFRGKKLLRKGHKLVVHDGRKKKKYFSNASIGNAPLQEAATDQSPPTLISETVA
jgi:hypothetical protein